MRKVINNSFITILVYFTAILSVLMFYYFRLFFGMLPKDRWMVELKYVWGFVASKVIIGTTPTFGGGSPTFFFHLAPLVFSLLLIFIVVTILEKKEFISRNKKIFTQILFFIISLFFLFTIFDYYR